MLRGHRKAQAATAKHRDKLLALPGVTGVFTGRKTVGGEKTDQSSVVISVAKKKRLPSVPKAQRIPPELDGIPTDVIQESFHTCTDDLTRYDPFQGGGRISVTPDLDDSFAAGTAGMIVSDVETKDPLILSCWHVLYGSGVGTEGDIVVNPPYSGGDPGPNTVGKLTRAVINSTVDAAVARVEGRAYSREIIGIGTPVALASAAVDMPVKKRGSASGLTTGVVTATDWSGPVDFGGIMGIINFTNIIRFEGSAGMVLGGDSGSVLCQADDVIAVGADWTDDYAINCHWTNLIGQANLSFPDSVAPIAGTPQGGAELTDRLTTGTLPDFFVEGQLDIGGTYQIGTIEIVGSEGGMLLDVSWVGSDSSLFAPSAAIELVGWGSDDGYHTDGDILSFSQTGVLDWRIEVQPSINRVYVELTQGISSWSLEHIGTDWYTNEGPEDYILAHFMVGNGDELPNPSGTSSATMTNTGAL